MNKDDFASFTRGLAEATAHLSGADTGALVHTPEQIAVRRKGGRPAGTIKANAKQQVAIRLDPDILTHFRAAGPGWQTRINEILRQSIAK
jgi:uncharacterized protein (DUF4415 family)